MSTKPSSSASSSMSLIARKMIAAAAPVRLLPSRNGWFWTMW